MNWEGCGRKQSWDNMRISWSLPGGTEEKYEILNKDSRCPCRDSNRVTPENKLEAILLETASLILGN